MILSLLYNLNTKEGVIITLTTLLLRIPAVLLALSVHEAAHGWVANKCGDPTAKNLGRIIPKFCTLSLRIILNCIALSSEAGMTASGWVLSCW